MRSPGGEFLRFAPLHLVAWAAFVNLIGFILGPPVQASPEAAIVRIVALGDSLTAGYRLPQSASFPAQLSAALELRGHKVEVINAGVSGDTTAAGLERLDWAISGTVDAVVLELGANDSLRGLAPAETRANLEAIITRLKSRGIDVLLAGMAAPRNLGQDYIAEFDRIYPDLAAKYGLLLYPFFLDGVAFNSKLNLDDGIHPTEKGVSVIVERMMPKVEELIARVQARRGPPAKT